MPAGWWTTRVGALAAILALACAPGCVATGADGGDGEPTTASASRPGDDGPATDGTTAGSAPFEPEALDPSVLETVFTVRTTTCGTSNRQRAVAVAVDEVTVVTVAHVFLTAGSLRVEEPDGSARGAELAWIDPARDLALLVLDEPVGAWLEPGSVDDGAAVGVITVEEDEVVAKEGRVLRHVTATLDGAGERAALELAAVVERGESGSPVVDREGRLVGLVFAASRGDERGWALDVSEISRALTDRDPDDRVQLEC